MNLLLEWLNIHWLEVSGMFLGFISIFLQIKQSKWYWPVSIVMVSLYIVVYFQSRFYADMSLQVYFFIIGFYGWYFWVFGNKTKKQKTDAKLEITTLTQIAWVKALLASLFFYIIIAFILVRFTNSDVPYGDAFTTALSFVATYMLARKILENWLFWFVADIVSVGLYFYKGLYPTAILFIVLSILAIVGYRKWKIDMNRTRLNTL